METGLIIERQPVSVGTWETTLFNNRDVIIIRQDSVPVAVMVYDPAAPQEQIRAKAQALAVSTGLWGMECKATLDEIP